MNGQFCEIYAILCNRNKICEFWNALKTAKMKSRETNKKMF